MKKIPFLLIAVMTGLLISGFLLAPQKADYDKKWSKVEGYAKRGLPRSAIQLIDSIYTLASKEGNQPQKIKALIYRVSMQSRFEEDHIVKTIETFKEELSTAQPPEKQILHSLLAELYQWYYQQNRWQINDRGTVAGMDQEDIRTWDAVRFNQVIREHYLASVENLQELEKIGLAVYKPFIEHADSTGLTLWPSLYDLLANRAVDYFSGQDAGLAGIAAPPAFDDYRLFAPVKEFVKLDLKVSDSTASQNLILGLYRHLLDFHLKQNNIPALVDLDIRRLRYVYSHFVLTPKTDSVYTQALTSLREQYRDKPEFVRISAILAARYSASAGKYNPLKGDEHRYDLNKALEICNEAIKFFPQDNYVVECKNLISDILHEEFNVQVPDAEISGEPFLSFLRFRNVKTLYFKVVELNLPELLINPGRMVQRDDVRQLLDAKPVKHWNEVLPDTKDHQSHTTEITVPGLGNGRYVLIVSDDPDFKKEENIIYRPFWITGLSYLLKSDPLDGNPEIYVLNRETGQPFSGISVKGYQKVYNKEKRKNEYQYFGEYFTNSEGYVKINLTDRQKHSPVTFLLERGCDQLLTTGSQYFYEPRRDDTWRTKTYLFTDRAVYRPGQTVYFKGIVVDKKGSEVRINRGHQAEVRFLNVNRKEVSKLQVTTNEFGSFQGSFVIPSGELNGQMTLKTKTGTAIFSVEEYKRPTFEVRFDTIEGEYKFGDRVTIVGNAMNYAGNPLINASVSWRVVRRVIPVPYFWGYRPFPFEKEVEIANGVTTTHDDGSFDISFSALPAEGLHGQKSVPCSFTVYADVTDITGEVQSGTTGLMVGPQSVVLTVKAGKEIQKENNTGIELEAKNLSGRPVDAVVTYSLFQLLPPDYVQKKRYWPQPDINLISKDKFREMFPHDVYGNENQMKNRKRLLISNDTVKFKGTKEILKNVFAEMKAGEYLFTAQTITQSGDTVKTEHYFIFYSTQSKKVPVSDLAWSTVTKKKAEPGDVVQLVIGSAAKKTKFYYEVVNGDEITQSGWLKVSNSEKVIDIPVIEKYRGNFAIHVYSNRYNRFYRKSFNVEVPFTNKKLDIKLETYRDYLTPGKKEEWKVTVAGPQGEKMVTELLAGMYDASLDVFRANKWDFALYHPKRNDKMWKTGYYGAGWGSHLFSRPVDYMTPKQTLYPAINWFGYEHGGYRGPVDMLKMGLPARTQQSPAREEVLEEEPAQGNEENTAEAKDTVPEMRKEEKVTVPLRTNFNETAFFYPQLRTDSSGNVVFSFTTPDALTEWKVMMLAYSKDLKTGSLIRKIKARKELMVMPNLPRFVRQGDQLAFSAKLINLSDKSLTVRVNIEFFNPITQEKIILFDKGEKPVREVSVEEGKNALLQWNITIPEGLDMMAYRIKAISDEFSDGEERMIPVLSNRMLVTETLPLYVNANQTKDFVFKKLKESSKNTSLANYRFTVEFTSNPAWYAIQALPYLGESKIENTGYLFHRFFANSLSAYIVNSDPKIKAVFESWKQITPEAFYSRLQKNEELKNLVLNATPWVLEAENETEQKRRIGILFDVNRLANEKESILAKLKAKQMNSGAWPWFSGMREDRHTTQAIVLGIGKLKTKGVVDFSKDYTLKSMTRKAFEYLDGKVLEDYNKLKKNNPKGMDKYVPGSLQVEFLYARSLLIDDFPVRSEVREAFDYYVGQLEKYWLKKNNYLQGMAALTLYKLGYRNQAEAVMRSLKERSLHNEEMGMYWRSNPGWGWYEAPVETQAMLLEAFDVIVNDSRSVEEMKKWLLKQKQTTHWKTNSATAEAVYSLLFTGSDLLAENVPVKLKVGKKEIIPGEIEGMKTEAGTGYFKTSWHGSEIKPGMADIRVTNPNNHIAWGGAYWQYFEDLDKITTAESPLSIEKQIFVQQLTDNGPVNKPLEEGQTLKTGDKIIVRLIIRTDRAMDYVQVTDMRAAALEPVVQLSGYSYGGGLGFYKSVTDVSMQYFIRRLPKGTFVLEYPLMVTQQGKFSNGIATIQSFYAPEFAAHSEGVRVVVK